MNGKDIHDAVEFVGSDLIHRAETQRYARPLWQSLLPTAAMIALLLGFGAVLSSPSQTPELSSLVSTEPQVAPAETLSTVHPLMEQFPILNEIPSTLQAETDWSTFYLNEAGLDDDGTDFYTIHGDQVLAIDAKNGILLIRVQGEDYQGVLAIANDPTKLSLQTSSQLGTTGETVGTIAQAHNGVLAVNASSFIDGTGGSNGGILAGYAMSDGIAYNENDHLGETYSRLEIDSNGHFSIVASNTAVGNDVQNAMEHLPAIIIDGVINDDLYTMWSGTHPRACIGQTEDGTVLMLVIEGRMPERSLGASLPECAKILARYNAIHAISLLHGTSAILWYDGEYVTKCSNSALPEGPLLPNAFVVERTDP